MTYDIAFPIGLHHESQHPAAEPDPHPCDQRQAGFALHRAPVVRANRQGCLSARAWAHDPRGHHRRPHRHHQGDDGATARAPGGGGQRRRHRCGRPRICPRARPAGDRDIWGADRGCRGSRRGPADRHLPGHVLGRSVYPRRRLGPPSAAKRDPAGPPRQRHARGHCRHGPRGPCHRCAHDGVRLPHRLHGSQGDG